jgi:PAS domain S-box-containing protein
MRGWTGLFSSAFAHSRNAMPLVDERRRHVDVNGACLRLLGYPRDQLIGRPVWELVHDGPRVGRPSGPRPSPGGRFTRETDLVTADGAVVAVQ